MFWNTARPSSMALTMLAVVVEQHHVGGFLGHVGAAPAHRDADVGGAQGRGVVHPSPVTATTFGLEGFDDAHFLVGGHPGEQDLRRISASCSWAGCRRHSSGR
jgi:hypothetical protein